MPEVEGTASSRYVKPFVSFAEGGDDQLQLTASLSANRIASWGFLAEAEARGIREYQISVILDGRTSAYCREVASQHRVFRVEDAKPLIHRALSAQDPNDLRTIQPWPNQSRDSIDTLKALDRDELVARNLQLPPFHPKCRSLLVQVGEEPLKSKPAVSAEQQILPLQQATPATFAELGQKVTPDQVAHWNSYVGVSPVAMLSKLTDSSADDLLAGKWKTLINFFENGDIGASASGVSQGAIVQIGTTLDPFSGRFYLDKADFVAGDVGAEARFLAKLLDAMVDIGGSLGVKSVFVEVSGDAVQYAKLGFLPSALSWQHIRQEAMDQIRDGSLTDFYAQLSVDEQMLLTHILQSNDEAGANLLVNLPWTHEGKTVGEMILGGVSGTFSLNLTDQAAVTVAKAYLGDGHDYD